VKQSRAEGRGHAGEPLQLAADGDPAAVRVCTIRAPPILLRRPGRRPTPRIGGDGHLQATPTVDLDEDGRCPWSSAVPRLLAFVRQGSGSSASISGGRESTATGTSRPLPPRIWTRTAGVHGAPRRRAYSRSFRLPMGCPCSPRRKSSALCEDLRGEVIYFRLF
jgi:hypothetical protein